MLHVFSYIFEVSIPARRATAAYGWIAWALKGPYSWWARWGCIATGIWQECWPRHIKFRKHSDTLHGSPASGRSDFRGVRGLCVKLPKSILKPEFNSAKPSGSLRCTIIFNYSQWARTAQGFLACSMLRCLALPSPRTSLYLGTTTCNPHLLVGCMVPWQVERGSLRSQEGILEWFCSLKWLLIETALLQCSRHVAAEHNSQRNWKTACETFQETLSNECLHELSVLKVAMAMPNAAHAWNSPCNLPTREVQSHIFSKTPKCCVLL